MLNYNGSYGKKFKKWCCNYKKKEKMQQVNTGPYMMPLFGVTL